MFLPNISFGGGGGGGCLAAYEKCEGKMAKIIDEVMLATNGR